MVIFNIISILIINISICFGINEHDTAEIQFKNIISPASDSTLITDTKSSNIWIHLVHDNSFTERDNFIILDTSDGKKYHWQLYRNLSVEVNNEIFKKYINIFKELNKVKCDEREKNSIEVLYEENGKVTKKFKYYCYYQLNEVISILRNWAGKDNSNLNEFEKEIEAYKSNKKYHKKK